MESDSNTRNNSDDRKPKLVKAIYLILFIFVFSIVQTVVSVVAVVGFLLWLINGKKTPRLLEFGKFLSNYSSQIVLFLTLGTDELPWPFSDVGNSANAPAHQSTS